jgi:glycosyltransferase involved in cell wall biosynthesis
MRIGLVIYGSLDTLSGGYLYDRMVVSYLESQGDHVEIISLPDREYPASLKDNFSSMLLKKLADLELDILLEDELTHPSLFWLNARLKRRVDYPIVAIVHHLRSSEPRAVWANWVYGWVERRYLSSVDGFIYNSKTTREVVERIIGAGRPGQIAFPAGDRLGQTITLPEIRTRSRKTGPLRIFFLGNVIPRKGLHVLIQALARLPKNTWRLTVAGSLQMAPEYAAAIQHQVLSGGIVEQVRFLGPLAESELAENLRRHQVLALPSFYEGFGIVYLEGMGFGLPAVGTTAGAASEIITHGIDGYLVPPGDGQALSECLADLARDRDRLARMSQAAVERFSRHGSWEKTGEQIREFLLDVFLEGRDRQ